MTQATGRNAQSCSSARKAWHGTCSWRHAPPSRRFQVRPKIGRCEGAGMSRAPHADWRMQAPGLRLNVMSCARGAFPIYTRWQRVFSRHAARPVQQSQSERTQAGLAVRAGRQRPSAVYGSCGGEGVGRPDRRSLPGRTSALVFAPRPVCAVAVFGSNPLAFC